MVYDWFQCGPVTKILKCLSGIFQVSYLGGHMPVDSLHLSWAAGEILGEIYLTDKMLDFNHVKVSQRSRLDEKNLCIFSAYWLL